MFELTRMLVVIDPDADVQVALDKAKELARKFRDNDGKFAMTPEVRAAGPKA